MKVIKTWSARIYISAVPGYSKLPPADRDQVISYLHDYINEAPLGVTLTPTTFVYPGGDEFGYIVGIINYARFPKPIKELESHTRSIAEYLIFKLKQYRCTIEFPDRSYLLENDDFKE